MARDVQVSIEQLKEIEKPVHVIHQISPNDYDSIKRCSNKDLVDADFSDIGSKLLNVSQ